jgi:hypothetical protein
MTRQLGERSIYFNTFNALVAVSFKRTGLRIRIVQLVLC